MVDSIEARQRKLFGGLTNKAQTLSLECVAACTLFSKLSQYPAIPPHIYRENSLRQV